MKKRKAPYLPSAPPDNLPTGVKFSWQFGEENLPKDSHSTYCVLCKDSKTGEEFFTFAEFILERLPGCKVDFDRWRVLGVYPGDCFARESAENLFKVIAWATMKREPNAKE